MPHLDYEKKLWNCGYKYIAGCDETGLGALAGEVFVSAVILPCNFDTSVWPGLDDSKKLTAKKRDALYPLIKEHALCYATATATLDEIEEHNVYWARFIAARRAIEKLDVKPDYIFMDGNAKIPDINTPQECIIKGDAISVSIAAASIIAKVERDRYIYDLADSVHPDYGWKSNSAYGTAGHRAALARHGSTVWHRSQFLKKLVVAPTR